MGNKSPVSVIAVGDRKVSCYQMSFVELVKYINVLM